MNGRSSQEIAPTKFHGWAIRFPVAWTARGDPVAWRVSTLRAEIERVRIRTELEFVGSEGGRRRGGSALAVCGAQRVRAPDLLFAALLTLSCLPIWAVAHVPTQDGASHVETIVALLRLPRSALLQAHYVANFGLQPNWLTQVLYAGLLQVASPAVAEKLLLTADVVLLPLAFRLALPPTSRTRWAALAVFPFAWSFAFHMGFWNFTFSLVLFVAIVASWSRWRGRLGARAAVALAALLVLAYFAHSVSTSAALASLSALLAWRAAAALLRARGRPERSRRVLRGHVRRALVTGVAALPVAALLAAFFLRQPRSFPFRPPLLDYAKHLAALYALVSFDRRELLLTVPLAMALGWAVVATLLGRGRRRLRASDAWLGAALLGTVLYFASPDAVIDGAQLTDRLALYPWLAVVLWLATGTAPLARVRRVAIVAAALFAVGTVYRVAKYRQIDAYVADYATVAPHVPRGSVLLPLTFAPGGPREGGSVSGRKLLSYRIDVARHLAGFVATERDGVNLGNSQANTRHAPLQWRPETNPFTLLDTERAGLETEPPCVELWTYTALAGPIDAIVVWGVTPQTARQRCGSAVLAELATGWERAFVSPHGTAELYLRKASPR